MMPESFPACATRREAARGLLPAIACASLVAVLPVATGCGNPTYPVTLSFKLADGEPLAAGFVAVQHTTDPAILGGGPIAADGTCRPLLRGRAMPGLPAGTYQVGVTGASTADFDAAPPPLPFDPTYMKPADSGLTFTVGASGPNQTAFSLKKPR